MLGMAKAVRFYCLLACLLGGAFAVPACSDGEAEATASDDDDGGNDTVPDDGDEVIEQNGVEIVIPKGAFDQPDKIKVSVLDADGAAAIAPIPANYTSICSIVEIEPHGASFKKNVAVSFRKNDIECTEGLEEAKVLRLDNPEDSEWEEIPVDSQIDDKLTLKLSGLSLFALVKENAAGNNGGNNNDTANNGNTNNGGNNGGANNGGNNNGTANNGGANNGGTNNGGPGNTATWQYQLDECITADEALTRNLCGDLSAPCPVNDFCFINLGGSCDNSLYPAPRTNVGVYICE